MCYRGGFADNGRAGAVNSPMGAVWKGLWARNLTPFGELPGRPAKIGIAT